LGHIFGKFPNNLGKIGNYEQCAFTQSGTGRLLFLNSTYKTTDSS
jgi:hypothetical protein